MLLRKFCSRLVVLGGCAFLGCVKERGIRGIARRKILGVTDSIRVGLMRHFFSAEADIRTSQLWAAPASQLFSESELMSARQGAARVPLEARAEQGSGSSTNWCPHLRHVALLLSGGLRKLDQTADLWQRHFVDVLVNHCLRVHTFLCSRHLMSSRGALRPAYKPAFIRDVWSRLNVRMHSVERLRRVGLSDSSVVKDTDELAPGPHFDRLESCWKHVLAVAEPRFGVRYDFFVPSRSDMLFMERLSDETLGQVFAPASHPRSGEDAAPVGGTSGADAVMRIFLRARRFTSGGRVEISTAALSSKGGCDNAASRSCLVGDNQPGVEVRPPTTIEKEPPLPPRKPPWLIQSAPFGRNSGSEIPICFLVDDQFAIVPRSLGSKFFMSRNETWDLSSTREQLGLSLPAARKWSDSVSTWWDSPKQGGKHEDEYYRTVYQYCLSACGDSFYNNWAEALLTRRLLERNTPLAVVALPIRLVGSSHFWFPDPMSGKTFTC